MDQFLMGNQIILDFFIYKEIHFFAKHGYSNTNYITFQEVQNLIDKLRRDFENASNQDRLIREVEKTSEDTCHKLFKHTKPKLYLRRKKRHQKPRKSNRLPLAKYWSLI